jgi:LPS-assembly lipoprotein
MSIVRCVEMPTYFGRRSILVLALLLAGCGFTPLYGEHDPAYDEELRSVQVLPIPERLGQRLAIELRDSLNPSGVPVAPRYYLIVRITTTRTESAIRNDATASREQFVYTASILLRDARKNETLFYAISNAFNAVDLVVNEYSIVVGERDAEARAARELAEDIRTRVALFLKRKKDQTEAPKRS